MTVQLEYINHMLQFFKNISYYAGIMLLLCSNYASIISWSLIAESLNTIVDSFIRVYQFFYRAYQTFRKVDRT